MRKDRSGRRATSKPVAQAATLAEGAGQGGGPGRGSDEEDPAAEDADAGQEGSTVLIVGVGASAGGLEAFTQMLTALPVDTGAAFVLIQHLAPGRGSALADILSRSTAMPVAEVSDEPEVQANHVYVIPPDRNMVLSRGHLRLLPREVRGRNLPIDLFFRSHRLRPGGNLLCRAPAARLARAPAAVLRRAGGSLPGQQGHPGHVRVRHAQRAGRSSLLAD